MLQSNNDSMDVSYHLLRAALNRFGKSPQQLTDEELALVRHQAIKELQLEQLILSSEEALDVHIPDSVLQQSLKQIKQSYPDEEAFKRYCVYPEHDAVVAYIQSVTVAEEIVDYIM